MLRPLASNAHVDAPSSAERMPCARECSLPLRHLSLACPCCVRLRRNLHRLGAPNVLFILADDYGWRDVSLEGSTFYETPHIDRIGREGMRFTQGYATCQVCSPSRASIMTGKFPARHGITDWIGAAGRHGHGSGTPSCCRPTTVHALPAEDTTLAEAFREAGIAPSLPANGTWGAKVRCPEDHGFEINVGGFQVGSPPDGFFAPYKNPKLPDGPAGESLPARLAQETARFIEDAPGPAVPGLSLVLFRCTRRFNPPSSCGRSIATRPRHCPPPNAVSSSIARRRFDRCRTIPSMPAWSRRWTGGRPSCWRRSIDSTWQTHTIVVFTSDNGGVSAGDGKATSNLPLRGGKGPAVGRRDSRAVLHQVAGSREAGFHHRTSRLRELTSFPHCWKSPACRPAAATACRRRQSGSRSQGRHHPGATALLALSALR